MEIPENYSQANFRFSGTPLPTGAEITIGFEHTLSTADNPVDMALALETIWGTSGMKSFHTTEITMSSVLVKWGPNLTGPSGEVLGNEVGTAVAPADSPNVSALIRKNTAAGGRAGRGRFFLPGTPQAQVFPDGALNTAWRASQQTVLNSFWTALNTAGYVPVLLHGAGSPISVPLPITSFSLDARVATQRRRLRR